MNIYFIFISKFLYFTTFLLLLFIKNFGRYERSKPIHQATPETGAGQLVHVSDKRMLCLKELGEISFSEPAKAMQRWCAKFGSLAAASCRNKPVLAPQWRRLLHHSPQFHPSLPSISFTTSKFVPLFSAGASYSVAAHSLRSSLPPFYVS